MLMLFLKRKHRQRLLWPTICQRYVYLNDLVTLAWVEVGRRDPTYMKPCLVSMKGHSIQNDLFASLKSYRLWVLGTLQDNGY